MPPNSSSSRVVIIAAQAIIITIQAWFKLKHMPTKSRTARNDDARQCFSPLSSSFSSPTRLASYSIFMNFSPSRNSKTPATTSHYGP